MALFNTKPNTPKLDDTHKIFSKIQQRRYQILVHSLLYYELDINLVCDAKWSQWAEELAQLQRKYPDISSTVIFAEEFKDFDGSTGFDLPYRDEQIVNIAYRLLKASANTDSQYALSLIERVQATPAHYSGFNKNAEKSAPTTKRKAVKKVETVNRKKLF